MVGGPWTKAQARAQDLDAVPAEASGENRSEVGFGPRAGQIEIGFGQGVNQRADDMRAADRNAARRADVRAKPIEKHDLPVEQHDGHLRPLFGMRRPAPTLLWTVDVTALDGWDEDVLSALAQTFAHPHGSIWCPLHRN